MKRNKLLMHDKIRNQSKHLHGSHGGMSWPNVGGLWKRKEDGLLYEVLGSYPLIIIREYGNSVADPIKLSDLVAFYAGYEYIGKAAAQ
jgi:hypothetical protein